MTPTLRLSVLMPVFDERLTVRSMVERVLAIEGQSPIESLELIVVDDGSQDGTASILDELAQKYKNVTVFHQENQGKGAAIRRALAAAQGDVSIVQDADLEYDPAEIPRLLLPFVEDGADAVFGSRFAPSSCRRVLFFWHSLGNRLLTLLCNMIADLDLTDMETCYKAVRTEVWKRIPMRSNRFGMEPELTIKLAKKGLKIFEVPISYRGRSYLEGKKIGFIDGIEAFLTVLHFWAVDDLYSVQDPRRAFLRHRSGACNLNRWLASRIAPHLGARVLEVGAGDGSLSRGLFARDRYVVTTQDDDDVRVLENMTFGRPFLETSVLDPRDSGAFSSYKGQFDTVLAANVLEHIDEEGRTLEAFVKCLAPGGRIVVTLPQGRKRFCDLDETVGHRRRYDRDDVKTLFDNAGLNLVHMEDFNRLGVMGWFLGGRLGWKNPGWLSLKAYNVMVPFLSWMDSWFSWTGLSLIAIGERKSDSV